jgi:hypothetical protein
VVIAKASEMLFYNKMFWEDDTWFPPNVSDIT